MDFHTYQLAVEQQVKSIPDTKRSEVLLYGLADQSGQVLMAAKKQLLGRQDTKHISERLGDVLWHLTAIITENGLSLQDIANDNIDKVNKLQ